MAYEVDTPILNSPFRFRLRIAVLPPRQHIRDIVVQLREHVLVKVPLSIPILHGNLVNLGHHTEHHHHSKPPTQSTFCY